MCFTLKSGKCCQYLYQGVLFPIQDLAFDVDKRIMDCMIDQLFAMLSLHSRLILIRFDLHLYEAPNDNQLISRFFKQVNQSLKTRYSSQSASFWVREQAPQNPNSHYHCYVILNGRKAKNSFGIKPFIERAQYLTANVSYYFPDNSDYVINRSDINSLLAAIYRISYLAKLDTKESTPKSARRYGQNRIKNANGSSILDHIRSKRNGKGSQVNK